MASPSTLHRSLELAGTLPALMVAADRVAATVIQGVHGRRRVGQGDAFWQYRPYRDGDSASQIDWRQSARSRHLFVRETEWEAAASVWLWRDASPSMQYASLKNIDTKAVRGELITLVNPEFVEREGLQLEEEGCLSIPGFEATVVRPSRIVLKGLDRDGSAQQREGTALLARAFQHEMDHLDGTLFVDRLRGIKRDLIVRRIKKLARAGKW